MSTFLYGSAISAEEATWGYVDRAHKRQLPCKRIQYSMPRYAQYLHILHPTFWHLTSSCSLCTTSLIPPSPEADCLQGLLAFDKSLIVAAQSRVAGWHVTNCAESGVVNLQWSTPAVTAGTKFFTSSPFAKMPHHPCPPELCQAQVPLSPVPYSAGLIQLQANLEGWLADGKDFY